MENSKILKDLEDIGLAEKHAKVYLSALECGGDVASAIAKKAGTERVNTYYILEQLAKEGLVYSGLKNGKRIYVAHSPKKLALLAEAKLRMVKGIIPELLRFESLNQTRPIVKFYEGVDGIKEVFNETLELPRGSETLAYASYQTVYTHLEDFVPDFIKRRATKGISQRVIVEDTAQTREGLQANDKRDLRLTRLVPKDEFPFEVDQINIFGDKMFIASLKDMIAMIIESPTIARTQRAIFELAWLGASTVCDTKKLKNQETKEQSVEKIQKTTQKVIFERDGKILMMKDTKNHWELPGGTIDYGEDADVSLRRELKEEMGLEPEHYNIGQMIGNFKIVREFPGKHYHFLALVYRGELKVDDFQISDEHTEYGWFAIPEILKLQMVEGYKDFFEKKRL